MGTPNNTFCPTWESIPRPHAHQSRLRPRDQRGSYLLMFYLIEINDLTLKRKRRFTYVFIILAFARDFVRVIFSSALSYAYGYCSAPVCRSVILYRLYYFL